jgi:hypothetical protein
MKLANFLSLFIELISYFWRIENQFLSAKRKVLFGGFSPEKTNDKPVSIPIQRNVVCRERDVAIIHYVDKLTTYIGQFKIKKKKIEICIFLYSQNGTNKPRNYIRKKKKEKGDCVCNNFRVRGDGAAIILAPFSY